jgi:hypothetical protein
MDMEKWLRHYSKRAQILISKLRYRFDWKIGHRLEWNEHKRFETNTDGTNINETI